MWKLRLLLACRKLEDKFNVCRDIQHKLLVIVNTFVHSKIPYGCFQLFSTELGFLNNSINTCEFHLVRAVGKI